MITNEGLQKAVDIFGSQRKLAKAIGMYPQQINGWVNTGKVPVKHCKKIEQVTNGEVTCFDLRPDVFPDYR